MLTFWGGDFGGDLFVRSVCRTVPFVSQQVVVPGAALVGPGGVIIPGGLREVLLCVLLKVCQANHSHLCTATSLSVSGTEISTSAAQQPFAFGFFLFVFKIIVDLFQVVLTT